VSIVREFREFAVKGNVVDMAVGVIIGAAFGKIVTSLVGDVTMPAVGYFLGGVDFSQRAITLREAALGKPAVVVSYGKLLQSGIDFFIVALVVFLAIKLINRMKRKEEAKPAAPPEPTAQEKLLTEIRDLLKER
jgi:large conductance mechanosensitive channel